MYKVFLNDRLIVFTAPGNITKNKPVVNFDKPVSANEIKKCFDSFVKSTNQEIYLAHPEPDHFFQQFQLAFFRLPAAGGVVHQNGRLLFIFRNGKWDLPKGKIDAGENPRQAALREVEEECGISGHKIVKQLPSTYHIYPSPEKEEWIFKETSWFEMIYSSENPGQPEKEEGITEIKWFRPNQLDEVWDNTYENLKQIIEIYRD